MGDRMINEETEIDLLELIFVLKEKWWMILAAGVLGFVLAAAFSVFFITPQYQSTSQMYVLSKETTLNSLADLQIGSQLTKDYKVMIQSRPVLEEVIEKLGLNINYKQLRKKLKVDNPLDTRILSLTVTDPDPENAKEIVNQIAVSSSKYIGDLMEVVPPKIIELGIAPEEKSGPSIKKNALMGAILGIFLISGIIIAIELLDDSVKSEEDLEKNLKRINNLRGGDMEILFNLDGMEKGFLYEESMRMLRTNLQFSGANIKVVLFTSSIQAEGKSETSFQLAMSLAQIDKKILYIDADMRKSVFTTRYHIKESVEGLSQFLSGMNTEDIIYTTNIRNLDVVFAGPYAPNPAELLYESRLDEFIKAQREVYDYIIIDTPPLTNIVDAAIIGRCVDGAVIVVKSSTVSQRMVKKVKDQLEKVNCRILGAVLNGLEMKKSSYHYKYYGDYYSYKK